MGWRCNEGDQRFIGPPGSPRSFDRLRTTVSTHLRRPCVGGEVPSHGMCLRMLIYLT